MTYSTTHEAMYADMCAEMLRHAGFQESVRDIVAEIAARDVWSDHDKRVIDDLFQIYADDGVLDDPSF